MKGLLSVCLCLVALVSLVPGAARAAEGPRTPVVTLDGYPLPFDVPPMIENGRTLVPFRAIAEALGVVVIWSEANQSIQAYGPRTMAYLKIGDRTMYVDGNAVELEVPPQIVNDRTLLPLRAFSEAFGAAVGWDEETWTISITSPVRTMRMLGFYALRSFDNRHLVPVFSDVAYGWARVHQDGSLRFDGPEYFWPEPAGDISPERLLADAAAAGAKRYLMVHELDGELLVTNLVLDVARRERFADSVAELVKAKGFDGVMLDLEQLGWSDKGERLAQVRQGYVDLVKAVADRLHPLGREVGVCLQPLNGWYFGYDYAAIAPHVDLIEVMAHDYVKAQPEPMERVDEAIRMAVEAVGAANRAKLLLGVLSTETPETLVEKVGLAKRHNLSGISFWTLGKLTPEQLAALNRTVTRTTPQ